MCLKKREREREGRQRRNKMEWKKMERGGGERESRPFVRETEMQAGHETTENEASVCEALPGFA